ncbi:MAG: hypothetical protein H7A51_03710 [Akkermansiaceae bacterium]|nr:hypothetical protein [Akkermansiaceae bacterium]
MNSNPPATRNLPVRILSWIEIAWFFVLPWLAYWIVIERLHPNPVATVLLGWAALLVYDILKIGMVLSEQEASRRPFARLLAILVPTAILATAQILREGDLGGFILELATLEFTVLVLAFPAALMFVKNDEGYTAWQDIGAIPLLIALIFGFGTYGFVLAWWQIAPSWDAHPLPLVFLLAAVAIEFTNSLRTLNRFAKRTAQLPDITTRPVVLGILLGQIVLWWILPTAVNFFSNT